MIHSSSTAPDTSDAQSKDGNDPLSLDAFLSAELPGGGQTDLTKNDEESTVAAPHHRDGATSFPEDFATPVSSDSPEDPEDVDHEEEAGDVDRDLLEADPGDGIDNSDKDDGIDINEDEVDGHALLIGIDVDSDSHQRGVERVALPRDRDRSEMRTVHEDEEITFADLGFPDDLLKAVTGMGFMTPTAIQKKAIPVLLAGRDVVGVVQTGTGKTAALGFSLFDVVDSRDSVAQTFVLAPTRELTPQSAEIITDVAVRSRGLEVVAVYGGAFYGPQIGALKGGAQVTVGTPGRVIDLIDRGAPQLDDVRCSALDEADEMLRTGSAENVEAIAESLPADRCTVLLPVTMPPAIQAVAHQHLHEPVQAEASRPAPTAVTVHQIYAVVPFHHKISAVFRVLVIIDAEVAIVFVWTKSTAEDAVIELADRGIQAAVILGDVSQRERRHLVERLCAGTPDVLAATDVAARGLDVDHIGLVVNFDVSCEAEAYVYRIGRTSRTSYHGGAVAFLAPKEEGKLRQIECLAESCLEEIILPSPVDVSEHCTRKPLSEAAARHERGCLDMYPPLAADSTRELDIDIEELAATLLAPAVGDGGPRRREDRGGERPQRTRREENLDSEGTFLPASFEDDREKGRRAEQGGRGERRRSATRSERCEYEGPGTVYRVEAGYRDRILPGAVMGALANKGGIKGSDIGKIDILQSFSLVITYADFSSEQLSIMGRATSVGRELWIHPDEGPRHGWSGLNGAERRPKRRDWEDRKDRGDRSGRGEWSEHDFRPRRESDERGWKDRDGYGGRGGYDRSECGECCDNRRWGERRGDRDGSRGWRENRGGHGYDRDGYRGECRDYGERNQNRLGSHRGGLRGRHGKR